MSELINWNCCTGGKEPDWSDYDALELAGCRTFDMENGDSCVERVDGEAPEFYSLYAHLKEGGCEVLHDFDESARLFEIQEQCRALAKRIPFPLFEYV